MAQPVAAYQYVNVGTVGTVLVTDRSCELHNIILTGTYVGSVAFYDCNTAAGTTATNNILTIGLPLLNQYKDITLSLRAKNGLVYASTGTPTITFGWD